MASRLRHKPRSAKSKDTCRDDYAEVKDKLTDILESGVDNFQDMSEPRKINFASLHLQGRHGLVIYTNKRGLVEVPEVSGIEIDPITNQRYFQRFFLGLNCVVHTWGNACQVYDLLSPTSSTSREFEISSSAHQLLKDTIYKAQTSGELMQAAIDEGSGEYFPRHMLPANNASLCHASMTHPSIDQACNLVSLARATVLKTMKNKLEECFVLFFSTIDSGELVSTDGQALDYTTARTGISIRLTTKGGFRLYDSIRGVGGLEVLSRFDATKSPEEAVIEVAETVAKYAVEVERAIPAASLGTNAYLILGDQVCGTLAHEVYGHASEADNIIQNKISEETTSNLRARVGSQVSSHPKFSIIDDGNANVTLGECQIRHCFGSIVVDSEGVPPQCTELVTNGTQTRVLVSAATLNEVTEEFPSPLKEAILAAGPTGNLRNQRFDHRPLIRMTNTFIVPNDEGPDSVEELAKLIPTNQIGIYIVKSAGGWCYEDTGNFQVIGQLGYLIENGTITDKPIRDIIINGNINRFGSCIEEIGSAKTMKKTASGYCGKESQWVPVDDGGPAILLSDVSLAQDITTGDWNRALHDYFAQMELVLAGKKRASEVYVKLIEQATGGSLRRHGRICMFTPALDAEDELRIILGKASAAGSFQKTDEEILEGKI